MYLVFSVHVAGECEVEPAGPTLPYKLEIEEVSTKTQRQPHLSILTID